MADLTKWEYKFIGFMFGKNSDNNATSENLLNFQGDEGWEIVTLMDGSAHGADWHIALMKRPK
jgi:hypothetical protein